MSQEIWFDVRKCTRYGLSEKGLFEVIEDGKYRMFEGNAYQCQVYISDRKRGFDTAVSTADAKRYKRPRKQI